MVSTAMVSTAMVVIIIMIVLSTNVVMLATMSMSSSPTGEAGQDEQGGEGRHPCTRGSVLLLRPDRSYRLIQGPLSQAPPILP